MFISLKSVCLITLFCQFCYGDSYFSQEVEKGDKDNKNIPVGVALIMKSEKIKKLIEHPSGYGKDLTKDLYFFLEEMQILLKAVQKENYALSDSQILTLKALIENGGPSHLKATVSSGLLIGKFGWTSIELNDLIEMINDTKSAWENIEKIVREKKIV